MSEEEEEGIIDIEDDDFDVEPISGASSNSYNIYTDNYRMRENVSFIEAYLQAKVVRQFTYTSFELELPTIFIPETQACVYGFAMCPTFCEVKASLQPSGNWKTKPQELSCNHPFLGKQFVGGTLIHNAIEKFFAPSFKPRSRYKCFEHIFKDSRIREIPSYQEAPLLYLILEIVDAVMDLSNHCCQCGEQLSISCIKPTACNKALCKFQLGRLGIGSSVVQEIRRDPVAADFIFSAFACACGSQYLNPAPPKDIAKACRSLSSQLPPMREIADSYTDDIDLGSVLGKDALEALRWIICTVDAQFISLPRELHLKEIPAQIQLMSIMASPAQEAEFQRLKQRHGSVLMWHGSFGDRWHAILRNGLKNGSGTQLQAHGTAHGSGIYLAPEASSSFGYCHPAQNQYSRSALGNPFTAIAMVEVAKVPELKNHGWCSTIVREEAVIVRMLFLGASFSFNLERFSPDRLPKFQQVVEAMRKNAATYK